MLLGDRCQQDQFGQLFALYQTGGRLPEVFAQLPGGMVQFGNHCWSGFHQGKKRPVCQIGENHSNSNNLSLSK